MKHLTTGEEAAVRADDTFNSASVIKIPVLLLAYQLADKGTLSLDERLTIRKEDIRGGSGIFRYHDVGLQPTLRDVLMQMVITSDNTATDLAIAKVGGVARVNAWLKENGYADGAAPDADDGGAVREVRGAAAGRGPQREDQRRSRLLARRDDAASHRPDARGAAARDARVRRRRPKRSSA